MNSRLALAAAVTTGGLLLAGCAGSEQPDAPTTAGDGVSVVATTTIWGDIASQVMACANAGQAESLTPIGADPHDYSPSARDITRMVSADLVVANGLGLEEGLEASLDSAQRDGARVLALAPRLDPLPFGDSEHDADHDEHGHDGDDPHVWMDAARAAEGAALIGAELAEVTGDPELDACGQTVKADLLDLDADIAATLDGVEPDRRILVTDHDALAYFAEHYGYTIAGTVVPGGSTLAEPSSAELADLAAAVRAAGVPAIFANTANPRALVDSLAGEAGDVEVVELHIGSLGPPGSGAETYDELMTTNAQRISDALAG